MVLLVERREDVGSTGAADEQGKISSLLQGSRWIYSLPDTWRLQGLKSFCKQKSTGQDYCCAGP